MFTVADALKLSVFQGAVLVAGQAGQGKPISWVHNSSVPDVHNWLSGGELVLTTALNMPQTLPEQLEYIRALSRLGVVGLVVTVGRDLDRIPFPWRDAANKHDFPLIALPYTTRFIDLARAVNERLTQESVSMLRRALHIHQVVTRLVLDEGGLDELARVLANLIGQSISIETDRFDALVSANIAAFDEARRYTLEHGRTNPVLIEALESAGILEQIRETLRPVQLPKMPHVGLEMERILAPIVVHGDIYGYMWIIADGSPLTDIDWMAIESGATVAALMMLHQEAVQSAEASLKGDLLSQLIEGDDMRASVLTDQAIRYGLDLDTSYRMLLLEGGANGNGVRLYRGVNRLAAEQGWAAIVGQFAGQVLVLLSAGVGVTQATAHIHQNIDHKLLRIGVSAAQCGYDCVSRTYAECREVLAIADQLGEQTQTVFFDQLGYIHALYHAGRSSLEGNPLVPCLRQLREETQADLFHTLEVYLDQGANGVATAEALHIHRSTLNYRLQRITQIIRTDLADPVARLNLQITLKQLRLFD